MVLKLYSKGLTTRDVSDVLSNFFGEEISYSQVSNLAERFHELRLAWENSALEPYYKVVYCDAIYITVRRGDSYSKEAVHIAYGVRADNKRELLELSVNPSESSSSWGEFIAKLKQRGVEKIDLVVADGLKGLEEEIHRLFPGTFFQKCVVHKMRNVKMIYTTNSIESLNKKLRKATKNKQSFEKMDRLLDYIFVIVKEFETQNWMKYPISKFSDWTQSL